MNGEITNRQLIIENLIKARGMMGRRRRQSNESLIIRFFRFLAVKLPERNITFNVKKGRIVYKNQSRRSNLFISVKDPFLKQENHGIYLNEENNFNRFVHKIKEFIIETSKGRIIEFLTQVDHLEDESDSDAEEFMQSLISSNA